MLNFGERFLEEDIELMIRLADLDDNGFIDFEEFVRMLTMDEEEGGWRGTLMLEWWAPQTGWHAAWT